MSAGGWAVQAGWARYHFFVAGRSLCGRFRHAGPVDAATVWTPIDCAECAAKARRRR